MFWMKMSQIDTKNDKNLKILEFPKVLCSFFPKFQWIFLNWNIERVNNEIKKCVVQ